MTTTINSLRTLCAAEIEKLPEYEGTRHRFEEGFHRFVTLKKEEAVRLVLREEVPSESLVKNPDFIDAIVNNVEDEAIVEKRYIFLSLNPELPE